MRIGIQLWLIFGIVAVRSIAFIYLGMNPVEFGQTAATDLIAGFNGEPAVMHYRPNWQNFALGCGQGGECEMDND